MSRLAKFVVNVRFNIYGQIFQAALPFFFVPFIIHHLGQEAYGLYVMIAVVTAQLNLLSFGAGPATVKYLAEFDAVDDHSKVERLIGNSLVFYGGTGLAGTVLIVCLAPMLCKKLLHISVALQPAAIFVFLCAAAVFLIQSCARTFHAVPQALQRFDWWNGMESACNLILYAGIYFLLSHGFWLRSLAAWSVVVALLNLGMYAAATGRMLPDMSLMPSYDRAMMRRVVGFGGWAFLGQICWSVLFQADKLVLGSFVPMAELTYYLVSFNLAQKLSFFLTPISPILLPFSSALHGKKDYDAARDFFLSGTKLVLIIAWPAAILGFFFGPAFLGLWLGGDFSLNAGWVLRYLLLGSFMGILSTFGYSLAMGFGKLKVPGLVGVSQVAAAIGLWFLLVPRYGVNAAAWTFCAVQVVPQAWFLIWCNRKFAQISRKQILKAWGSSIGLSIPLVIVSALLRNSLVGWMSLGAFGAAAYMGTLILCYFGALTREEKERVSRLWAPRSATT